MLAPIAWRVPPRHYGPWERVVSLLTEGLVEAGVDVTLFATADSETAGTLSAVVPRPYEEDRSLDPKVWEGLHLADVFEQAGAFDLIHNHYDFLPLTYSGLVQTPVLTTVHGFSSERIVPVYKRFDATTHYVAISDADRHPDLSYAATIYHGIDLGDFTLNETPDDYLLFFGRIHPDKGVAEAVEVARRTGRRLVVAGIVQDREYFERVLEPHLTKGTGEQIQYVGSVGPEARNKLLGGAAALLHLINFDEPFGLSMIEAMACGTPVVATKRGSVPEVVRDGVSGFVVESADEAVGAVQNLGELPRVRVREYAEARFSRKRMVDDYLRVYEKILNAR